MQLNTLNLERNLVTQAKQILTAVRDVDLMKSPVYSHSKNFL